MHKEWSCPKCGNRTYETDEIRTTGSGLSKIFDVQNRAFTTVSCTRCRFTELYKTESSTLGNIFDLFTN